MPDISRPTFRIDEEEDEDESRELEKIPPRTPPPRAFGGGIIYDDDSGGGDNSNIRLTFSDIAKQIQNPGAGGFASVNSSNSSNSSAGSKAPATGGRDRSGSSGLRKGNANKRIFGGGTSDAVDHVLEPGLSSQSPQDSFARKGKSGSSTELSESTLRSSSNSSNRRKYLQTIHSERSLKSEASSSNPVPNFAGIPRAQSPRGLSKGVVEGSDRNSNASNSPNRRSLMRRAPAAVKPGQQYDMQGTPNTRRNTGIMSNSNTKIANTRRANLLASRLASRTTAVKTRMSNEGRKGGGALGVIPGLGNSGIGPGGDSPSGGEIDVLAGGGAGDIHVASRRYKPGDYVLVCNQQSRWSTLVNRYGFPPGEGSSPEEMRGPYIFAMATVKQVHFEEFAAYYTVTRVDTGAEHRADADFMEPIRSLRGQQAAFRAAQQSSLEQGVAGSDVGIGATGEYPFCMGVGDTREMGQSSTSTRNKVLRCLQDICFALLLPFLCIYDALYFVVGRWLAPVGRFLLRHARLVLMGLEPYSCQLRLTMVNFIVLCSFWYMFIDQARLAWFPPQADGTVAVLNFIVWFILLSELLFEVLIRPDGYKKLIVSEKAFSPQTVRFINAFHFLVELLSLLMFVPEFYCLFSGESCSTRFKFSFYNAALKAVTGPTRAEAAAGRLYFALIRLRVFGVVRHWKNMWITNTFLMGRKHEGGWLSIFFPPRASNKKQVLPTLKRQDSSATETGADGMKGSRGGGDSPKGGDQEQDHHHSHDSKDETLTNASNIGTALMVTNSYRAISLLWVITGVFPVIVFSMNSVLINNVALAMTEQIQGTNVIAQDESQETCDFLVDSVYSWVMAVVAPDVDDEPDESYLITLDIQPYRCNVTSATTCRERFAGGLTEDAHRLCETRRELANKTKAQMADTLGVRVGSIVEYESDQRELPLVLRNLTEINANYSATACFDKSFSIKIA